MSANDTRIFRQDSSVRVFGTGISATPAKFALDTERRIVRTDREVRVFKKD
mgnify:FL=1